MLDDDLWGPDWDQSPHNPAAPTYIDQLDDPAAGRAPFPTDSMPTALRAMITAVAGNKQVPHDCPALLGLSAAAVLAAPRIAISAGPRTGWTEPLTLYTAVAMESGSGKSPAERDVSRPLRAIQRRLRNGHGEWIADKIFPLNEEAATAALMNTRESRVRAAELERQIEELRNSPPPRVLLPTDFTVESLARDLAQNGGAGGIMDGEGGVFAELAGRYKKGVPDLNITLKAYDGDYYDVGRIGRDQAAIDRAILAMGIAVQPLVLEEAAGNRAMVERGLLARFLFSVPRSLVGTRAMKGADFDPVAMEHWGKALDGIAAIPVPDPADEDGFPVLQLDDLARDLHLRYRAEMEPRLGAGGDLGDMPGWAAKHVGRILRLAGLLHLLAGREVTRPVGVQPMLAAITIGNWAIPHAQYVFRQGQVADPLDPVDHRCHDVIAWLATVDPDVPFVARDVQRGRGMRKEWARTTPAIVAVLDRLVGMRRIQEVEIVDGAGRRKTAWKLIKPADG